MVILHKKEDVSNLIADKNKVVDEAVAAEKMLNAFGAFLNEKAKTDIQAKVLRDEFYDKINKGKKEGEKVVKDELRNAINKHPKDFIIDLFKYKLTPDVHYSFLKGPYNDLLKLQQEQEAISQKHPKLEGFVGEVNRSAWAEDISKQERAVKDKIKLLIDYDIEKVVEWITRTKLLNEYVLEPAGEKGSIAPADAKKILQNALDKLIYPGVQTQSEEKKNPSSGEGQKQGSEEKKEEKKEENPKVTLFGKVAEGFVTSELLAEMSKREASIEKFITGIEKADPKLLQKANAAILQFNVELQAILNKVDLSDKEREQLQKLQEQLNSAVEEKAKQLNVGTKILSVSDKHLKATEEHIENLTKEEEKKYIELITKYHNLLVQIFAEEYGIPAESIDETLEERISRHTALAKALRERSKGESESLTPAEGFNTEK